MQGHQTPRREQTVTMLEAMDKFRVLADPGRPVALAPVGRVPEHDPVERMAVAMERMATAMERMTGTSVDMRTAIQTVETPVEVMPVIEASKRSKIEKRLRKADLSDDRAVFIYVANHMIRQEGPVIRTYRGRDDTASVYGCLLTDEEARIGTERSLSIGELIKEIPTVAERLKHFNINLLHSLYRIHTHQYQSWRYELLDELWYDYGGRSGRWAPVLLGPKIDLKKNIKDQSNYARRVITHWSQERDRESYPPSIRLNGSKLSYLKLIRKRVATQNTHAPGCRCGCS